jgi:hypothetical protein
MGGRTKSPGGVAEFICRRCVFAVNMRATALKLTEVFNTMGNSGALLITYPDYPVDTDTWYGYTTMVGMLVFFLLGLMVLQSTTNLVVTTSQTWCRKKSICSHAVIASDGRATPAKPQEHFGWLSADSRKKTRIRAAYFINVDFDKMLAQATAKQPQI